MKNLGITLALSVLLALGIAALALLLTRVRGHVQRLRLTRLRSGDAVEVMTPDRRILVGVLVAREERHVWVDLEPGDARLRVPWNWVSAARLRAPRRSAGSGTGTPPQRAVSARRAGR